MRKVTVEERGTLLASFKREALHLELRDSYASDEYYEKWLSGQPFSDAEVEEYWRDWKNLISGAVRAGKSVRRLRVVSEPLAPFIRHEWESTGHNIEAGEDVRWLPRRLASALLFPGNDLWLFDEETVFFHVHAPDGEVIEYQMSTNPAVAASCKMAFEAAWHAAIPHAQYQPQ